MKEAVPFGGMRLKQISVLGDLGGARSHRLICNLCFDLQGVFFEARSCAFFGALESNGSQVASFLVAHEWSRLAPRRLVLLVKCGGSGGGRESGNGGGSGVRLWRWGLLGGSWVCVSGCGCVGVWVCDFAGVRVRLCVCVERRCAFVYVRMCVCVFVYMWVYMCYVCLCAFLCVSVYVCACVFMSVFVCLCGCVCVCVCVCGVFVSVCVVCVRVCL